MKKYKIIYADPAWKYGNSQICKYDGERFHKLDEVYNTMKDEDIKKLRVKDIADNDSVLFLWVTDSHIREGLEVMKAWGFDYKTIAFNWIKTTNKGNICCNLGAWTMKSWELCLIGTRGRMLQYKKSNKVKGLVFAERTVHSKKPQIIRDNIVELFGDLPRVELFARQKAEGWDVWGNEVESDISL